MSLIRTGQGVTDIRGGFGGVYFTRDKSGLHCTAKPRRVHQKTTGQRLQRDAFSAARRYSKDNRVVSYLMYRYMNGLYIGFFAAVTGELIPDATGTYIFGGQYNGKDYYRRKDGAWFIWWQPGSWWYISVGLDKEGEAFWVRMDPEMCGNYETSGMATGDATVTLSFTDPPPDYQIPKL